MLDEIERVSHPENEDFGFEIYLWGQQSEEMFNDGEITGKNDYRRFIHNLDKDSMETNHSPYVDEFVNFVRDNSELEPYHFQGEPRNEILARTTASRHRIHDGFFSRLISSPSLSGALEKSISNEEPHMVGLRLNNGIDYAKGTDRPSSRGKMTPCLVAVSDEQNIDTIFEYIQSNPEQFYNAVETITEGYDTPNFDENILEPSENSGRLRLVADGNTETIEY